LPTEGDAASLGGLRDRGARRRALGASQARCLPERPASGRASLLLLHLPDAPDAARGRAGGAREPGVGPVFSDSPSLLEFFAAARAPRSWSGKSPPKGARWPFSSGGRDSW